MMMMSKDSATAVSVSCSTCRCLAAVKRRLVWRPYRQPPVQHALPDIAFDPGHHEEQAQDHPGDRRREFPHEIAARALQRTLKEGQAERTEDDQRRHRGGDPRP